MTSSTAPTASTKQRPTIGALVSVRGQQWVVSDVEPAGIESDGRATVVGLQSVDRRGDTLEVVWDVEPGRRVLLAGSLPDVATDGFDPPERLAAFLDAVRWIPGGGGLRRPEARGNPIRAARRWIDGLMRLCLALRLPVRRGHTWGHDRHPR